MVNPISTDVYNDAYVLTRYNYNVPEDSYSFSDAATSAGVMAGGYSLCKGVYWLGKNRKDYKTGWQNVKNQYAYAKAGLKNAANLKDKLLFSKRTQELLDLEKRYPYTDPAAGKTLTAKQRLKHMKQYMKNKNNKAVQDIIQQTKKELQDGNLTGKRFAVRKRQINKAIEETAQKKKMSKIAGNSGNAARTAANTSAKSTAKAVTKGGKIIKTLGKSLKGNIVMTGIALALEAPTIIKTYKTLGKKKGNKQLLKSTAIAGAGVAGYIAGSAALGAAVGSVVPIAGTAVGAVVGLVGGLLGAWGADTLARKVLPSELEIAAKEEAEEAVKNPEKMKEVLKNTDEKAETETDETVLSELRQSYNNLSVLTDDTQYEQIDDENSTVKQEITSDSSKEEEENEVLSDNPQTQKKTRNKSKLLETLNWFKQMLAKIKDTDLNYNSYYNQYNNQYNSYETPFYQMRSQYGYIV